MPFFQNRPAYFLDLAASSWQDEIGKDPVVENTETAFLLPLQG
jgi:hypothetical protein